MQLRSARFALRAATRTLVAALPALLVAGCIVPAPGGGGGGGGGGGIVNPGPQPVQASYVVAFDCSQRQGQNGGYGFWDVFLNQCLSCPAGYGRTVWDVNGPTACEKGGPFGDHAYVESLGGAGCPSGTFQNGNACYQCPAGTSPDPSLGAGMCI